MKRIDPIVALYIRLSDEDEDNDDVVKRESNSITNQRLLLRQVVKNHPEFEGMTVVEYADDGYSGMNFGRPQFNLMMTELMRGNICCVIVKDLSRFARNYIEGGNYLERIFPMYHVRFIAVNDNYDSNDYIGMTGGMEMAFKNYMNTMYAKDLSLKVVSGRNIMAREGLFVGAHAPYGYKKDPKNCHKLIIDKESAAIVRRIFKEAAAGIHKSAIATYLNNDGVPTVIEYQRSQGHGRKWVIEKEKKLWTITTISDMLRNKVYIGTTITNKYKRLEVGSHRQRRTPESEWIVVENTHEAIVSKELFQKANEEAFTGQGQKRLEPGKPRLFICGSCGRTMGFTGSNMAYRCARASSSGLPECKLIKRKRYPFEEEVLATAKKKADELNVQLKKDIATWNHNIREWKGTTELREKAEKLSIKKLKLYDQYREGKISKNTYMQSSEKISAKQMELADQLAEIDKKTYEANRNLAASVDVKTTLTEVRKLDSFDTAVLKKIIKYVKVYEDHIEYEWADFVK